MQTPYSRFLYNNFEEPDIQTEEQRLFFYGQENHVRVFGEKAFFASLKAHQFHLEIHHHAHLFQHLDAHRYGVPHHEPIILAYKPV